MKAFSKDPHFAQRRRKRLTKIPPTALAILRRMAAGDVLSRGTSMLLSGRPAFGMEAVNNAAVNSLADRRLIVWHYDFPSGVYTLTAAGREALALVDKKEEASVA